MFSVDMDGMGMRIEIPTAAVMTSKTKRPVDDICDAQVGLCLHTSRQLRQ